MITNRRTLPTGLDRIALAVTFILLAASVGAVDCQDYAGGMRWLARVEFSFSGNSDIAFKDDIAYVAMNRIKLVDVSAPHAPSLLGEIASGYANPRRITATADLLVASIHTDVEVYSIAQTTNPQFRARYQTPDSALDVCLVNDICYVGCADVGLVILDLADPADPVEVGIVSGNDCRRVAHQDGYLYTVWTVPGGAALIVYDLADPANPVETYRWGNSVIDAVLGDDRLYVAMALSGFAVFSLTQPAFPDLLGTQDPGGFTTSVNGTGDYVFSLYSGASQIECYATTGSPPWPLVDAIDTDFGPDVLTFHHGHAYAPSNNSLEIFDLDQPEGSASLLGYHENWENDAMAAVVADGGYAFVTNRGSVVGENRVDVIDVHDPAAPTLVHSLSYYGSAPVDFALGKGLLYVADLLGIDVVDISDPAAAKRVGRVESGGTANQIAATGTHLYLADGADGLRVATIEADPLNPAFVARLPLGDNAVAVALVDDLALVLTGGGVLKVIDAGIPQAPILVGELGGLTFGENVAVQGTLAFVDGDGDVYVIDIADPGAPTLLASVDVPGVAHDLVAVAGALYVAARTAGLQVVDVTIPTEPVLVGSLALEYISRGIAVAGDVVYVASATRLNLAPLHCASITGVADETPAAAPGFALGVHPNPFNPATRIRFTLAENARVDLAVFDARGRRVKTLLTRALRRRGGHVLNWHGLNDAGLTMPSGVYLLRLRVGGRQATSNVTLTR